jgi:hypothetical protein
MHKYFWAMFYETKQDKYKYMALSVKQRGDIVIPKRPYYIKTIESFKTNKLPSIINKYIQQLWK